ncbi:MAG: flagellar basal body-associated FliL family protein [Paludibacterium sp.]|uniref:flagellar basal body-associated FliL family protein n=1 Tax=Paludibacterium sp. TaxID=1917523 RepID=UPI0025D094B5|nr:flagellar basal body-associated FliL family protein [Paludibacterium sp.]MBV8047823.1 flagellar basal body-associated FliL family protein [Paludibacterium sp.]MBV8648711.1 flagellar basal body-associated FliL family protein [Paludibacterium sp.]
MAEDKKLDKGAPPEEKPRGGGNKMMMVVVLLLVVLIGGVGGVGYLFISGHLFGGGQSQAAAQPKKSDVPPVFSKLDTFVVNLSGQTGALLQVDMQCELSDADAQKRLTDYMPKVRSAVILLLSAKTVEELGTPEGKLKLKNQVKQVINGAMDSGGDEPVKSVLFTSFIIQNS